MSTGPERDDLLAQAIHLLYLEQRLANGEQLGSTASLVEWAVLPEEFRDSSREQARVTTTLLATVGCAIEDAEPGTQTAELTDAEVEQLAELSHERWLEKRLSSGWRHGTRTDEDHRLHPDLMPWDDLADDRREIDRHLARRLPSVLASLGRSLVRHPEKRAGASGG